MLYKEKVAVYFEIHTQQLKAMRSPCGIVKC